MAGHEQAYTKLTLLYIKDWDSFQIAMRGCLYLKGDQNAK